MYLAFPKFKNLVCIFIYVRTTSCKNCVYAASLEPEILVINVKKLFLYKSIRTNDTITFILTIYDALLKFCTNPVTADWSVITNFVSAQQVQF